ncbi:MAG: hypothetical protein A2655_04220 [Candidatus Yanofskybacteria bacterium RIFCSPHIGHO2_01_FULL_43_42]|uniref:Uncharacterized protein n=1 Tax=Candidatus Yanofskybacteria bacterium RIFCSPLOWO2_01_FULL_43_22 TaxID=1802695 RepID=A0A1F8GDF5_9BACT|nr:MAG: hypothetical protein A2655_04220 [Candidatus Yanofskybacteria bacterium RIFCSPHIGHO2_01_FULL_43_42]OGN12699.1 MAG: hypothetical protein A3D48_01570 [Candidatus Yanofskybacteria bacterium RIFCSPHIGHO2_02_FULL_43_17]OGN23321.1 MAG: hypothetical protein A3A13_04340 [Candidatus Yanofskybacteria bacterium RIFCSPLOWO2_01_FULL_43_22]
MRNSVGAIIIAFISLTIAACAYSNKIENVAFGLSEFSWERPVRVYEYNGEIRVTFHDVVIGPALETHKVMVNFSNLEIGIRSTLPGTALTVVPSFPYYLFYIDLPNYLSANSVIVWVQTEDEMHQWKKWLARQKEEIEVSRRLRATPGKVVPR